VYHWKHALSPELADPRFQFSVLTEFGGRLNRPISIVKTCYTDTHLLKFMQNGLPSIVAKAVYVLWMSQRRFLWAVRWKRLCIACHDVFKQCNIPQCNQHSAKHLPGLSTSLRTNFVGNFCLFVRHCTVVQLIRQ
jgi:hypothetical protein